MRQATTISEVMTELDDVVAWARNGENCLGYFAALYRKVTRAVARRIQEGFFEDGERMARLDVIFANRYLEALADYQNGKAISESWHVAFEASQRWWPIVLQHLLLGINAHINLDLGIAAARTSFGSELAALKTDFERINDVLLQLLEEVERQLNAIWPLLALLDRLGGRTDEVLINFSMKRARACAWDTARSLAAQSEEQWGDNIRAVDHRTSALARRIGHPGARLGAVLRVVRLGELKKRSEVIEVLS
jgi:Family of unknown function (DUF5995)